MPSREPSPEPGPSDPKPIRKLQQSLINRIAAGEIIHRPSSALKELIENCLDAGAKSIKVTVKDGGLKLLQIQDDGCGIKKADLPILAQRFTTSKLQKYDDLQRLTTYGFRGEALASISHVAHLTVITKTKKDNCAWRASFSEGVLVAAKAGASAEPKPTAGNDGTTIMVEDLFYNAPQRLSALRASAEEYRHIADVVEKYSIHNASVSFTLKKVGTSSSDVLMPANSTTPQAISSIYGQSVAKSLLNAVVTPKPSKVKKRKRIAIFDDDEEVEDSEPEREAERPGAWKAEVHFTNANYHAKKTTFLLFINHRLVESPRMKRSIEAVYTGILPKGTSPFVYLSLELDPATVDPNVHPTKKEVHFLNEEAITERIADEMQNLLASVGERTFEYQTLLTGGVAEDKKTSSKMSVKGKEKERSSSQDELQSSISHRTAPKDRPVLSQYKVRTSAADRTLDSMFPAPARTQSGGATQPDAVAPRRDTWIQESSTGLTLMRNLRKKVIKTRHAHLHEIIEQHTFVSVVDLERELSLIQHSTRLYLVSHGALCEELFYQLGLRQFGNLPRLKLDPPPSLHTLISFAVGAEKGTEASGMNKEELVDTLVEMVISRRDMLDAYFSICISEDGLVEAVPLLLPEFIPNLDKLPLFLMRLGPQVDWEDEGNCYHTICREIAYFYTPGPDILSASSPAEEDAEEREQAAAAEKWQIQHTLFPAMRKYLMPPESLLDRDIVQVADLPDLYRVFERC